MADAAILANCRKREFPESFTEISSEVEEIPNLSEDNEDTSSNEARHTSKDSGVEFCDDHDADRVYMARPNLGKVIHFQMLVTFWR